MNRTGYLSLCVSPVTAWQSGESSLSALKWISERKSMDGQKKVSVGMPANIPVKRSASNGSQAGKNTKICHVFRPGLDVEVT